MTDPVLAARGVRVERDGQAVLDGVDLTVEPADRILIQGRSGAGKTTLFSVLGLLEPPDAGTVEIDGQDTSQLTERERARLRRTALGFVYQDFRLVPDLTARENAALPQDHAGERDEAWLDDLFERLDIEHVAGRHPASLSGGEKQRVATARALANRPDVVLADEPTGQLDPETADQLLELLCSLQETVGTALVVVSHDRSLVDRFSQVYRLEGDTLSLSSSSNS
ncbi:ABC transporter ATP-binding protein [Halosimplex amylolyticum]|uniref:ABC transporter ATP-binding protein n=1 Tax=Halosimplex amylolyticum TaxID=3396616 RepID=UPI003F55ED9C